MRLDERPTWTIHNDRLSVSVGINHRIGLLKRQGKRPVLIRLGGWATGYFLREYRMTHVPTEPYYYAGIPVIFRDPKIIGIAVEGEDMPPKKIKATKKHPR
ncbi:MAG: hypothetical protein ACOY9Y_09765 [Bacillota bacterium]